MPISYLPKFRHALLDLSVFEPSKDENDAQMRVVLQLMKLAREKKLLEFFAWLAVEFLGEMSEGLLRTSLLYALHADTNLDVEQIAHTLEMNHELRENTMSIAQKLIAKGKVEGRQEGRLEGHAEGLWMGKIQMLQNFMQLAVTPREALELLDMGQLEARFAELQRKYDLKFKGK
jgi:flagellar biosynthesis/type III secretory pathway protein FliH